MAEEVVTVHVDAALKTAFSEAAKSTNRTTSQALEDLMRDFVDRHDRRSHYDVWLSEKVEDARAEVRGGHVQSHAEVEARFAEDRSTMLSR